MLLESVLQCPASLTNVDLGACSTGDTVHNTRSLLWWPSGGLESLTLTNVLIDS